MKIDEAIKQCEGLINSDITETIHCANCEHDCTNKCVEEGCLYNIAIETVLKDRERLIEENKHLKSFSDYETICLENNNLQEHIEMLQSYYKDFYISKDKIRAKIEEKEKEIQEYIETDNTGRFTRYNCRITDEVNVLKELLEE